MRTRHRKKRNRGKSLSPSALSLSLSLSLFACLRAFFIHSKFCIDVVSSSRGHPRGDVALIFSERGRHRCETHARAFPRKSHRKKEALAFCLSFFLSSSLSRAKAREKSARAAPKQRDFFVFAFSFTINTLRVLHSLTYSNRQTDIFERKDLQKKKKKKKYARFLFFGRWF